MATEQKREISVHLLIVANLICKELEPVLEDPGYCQSRRVRHCQHYSSSINRTFNTNIYG